VDTINTINSAFVFEDGRCLQDITLVGRRRYYREATVLLSLFLQLCTREYTSEGRESDMLRCILETSRLPRKVLEYPQMLELGRRTELRLEERFLYRRARDNERSGQVSLYIVAANS
jgi:hypothetical protein